jgi:PAS domain S-box-containing protein
VNVTVDPDSGTARRVQSDAMFRAAADQAPLVMWIVNAKGAVTYLNHCWYELVGGTPPEGHGHAWADACHPDDVAEMRRRWKSSSKTGQVFEGTRRVKARDGSWHILSYRAMPVIDTGGLACWVGMDSDITEMVETQAALRFANTELRAFSQAVSHDLRSPLAGMQRYCQSMIAQLGAAGDAKLKRNVHRISHAASHMMQLVEGLLALTTVNKGALDLRDVDLTILALSVLDRLSYLPPGRRVETRVAEGMTACADERLLAVLLENLLGNAWKFTAKVEHARIEVGQEADTASEHVFFVRDNGAGFDMARAGKLFTAFERLHADTDYPGMGLGLATVSRIVERHGGRLWAEAQVGAGSTFRFALPKPRKR